MKYETYEEASSAAIKLNIVKKIEYVRRYKEDSRLPAKPEMKYSDKWISWKSFLGVQKYALYEDAKAAAQALRCENSIEYKNMYKEDPLLPSDPAKIYADEWEGFSIFLDQQRYGTYEEAEKAVQNLGITKTTEYKVRFREDKMLPAHPNIKYQRKGWVDWFTFFGTNKKELYKTYEEAAKAAKKLKAKTYNEYVERYQQDPRLTRVPERKYKGAGWVSWQEFLRGLYPTVKEAQEAARKLKIRHPTDYKRKRKKDPMLPYHPQTTYKNKGWVSWQDFLSLSYFSYEEAVEFLNSPSVKIKVPFEYMVLVKLEKRLPRTYTKYDQYYDWPSFVGLVYQDPLDAVKLIRKKGVNIENINDYKVLRKLYRSLPEDPLAYYGFSSFFDFLNFSTEKLWDLRTIKKYCHDKKIKTREEYDEIASKIPELPNNPKTVSPNVRIDRILYKDPYISVFENEEYYPWVKIADDWLTSTGSYSTRRSLIKNFFVFFKKTLPVLPEYLCDSKSPRLDINSFIDSLPDSQKNISSVNHLQKFFDFVIERLCSHHCEETGEIIVLEGYENPINRKVLTVDFQPRFNNHESTKPALPFRYIQRARHLIIPPGKEVLTFSELYERLKYATDFFDFVGEWFVADKNIIDDSDPNCVWRKLDGVFELWSPVRVVAIYTQLFMPFRGSQICWLDSGEADYEILEEENGKYKWVNNQLLKEYRVPKKYHQGFFKPGSDKEVVCHVSTNKTASNAFEGYDIPWVDERIIPLLIQLRNWQSKYNPLEKPTKWTNQVKTENDRTLRKYGYKGRSCFLFRDPSLQGGIPLTQAKLSSGFAGVLHLIQDKELPLTMIRKGKKDANSLSNLHSLFTLHSMRVSLITAFIRDAKIAPEVVQKLVGHSSLVMTIYYTKVTAEEIREALNDAESLIIKNQANRVDQLIRQGKMDQITSELVNSRGELVKNNSTMPSAAYTMMDYGICPNGRTKCDIGGDMIGESSKVYHPTPAGYLGNSNCLRCRFFYSGPAFLGGLQMLCNEITLECKAASIVIDELRQKIDTLEDEQYQKLREKQDFTGSHEIALTEAHYEQEVTRFDSLVCDLIVAIRLSMNSINILNSSINDSTKSPHHNLITTDQDAGVFLNFPEVSNFLHVDMVCQSASYHQSSRPQKATLVRTQLLDLFARKNGLSPGLFALSERQQLEIGNEITKMLRSRLGGWDAVSELMDKDAVITLEDLQIEEGAIKEGLQLMFNGQTPKAISLPSEK
ncbi:hypothetical protein K7H09_21560 [Halomonas sp. IOP_14]|uniref:gamma-mobile-trio integrase GmtZ n=1 Tax=Halomonas sp. IOP_14 TaxID=2873295 RepID=UPI001E2B2DA6|nr:VPA1269 family protein [Halomonas sp. IOP_14]MCD1588596.1 hypothetical protein [Halomonas sp. IOP_14]